MRIWQFAGRCNGYFTVGLTTILLMESTRKEILELVAEISDLYPHCRFGQTVANIVLWAKGPARETVWDVEDEQFLEALQKHLQKKRREPK